MATKFCTMSPYRSSRVTLMSPILLTWFLYLYFGKCAYPLVYSDHRLAVQIVSQHKVLKVQVFCDVTLSGSSSPRSSWMPAAGDEIIRNVQKVGNCLPTETAFMYKKTWTFIQPATITPNLTLVPCVLRPGVHGKLSGSRNQLMDLSLLVSVRRLTFVRCSCLLTIARENPMHQVRQK